MLSIDANEQKKHNSPVHAVSQLFEQLPTGSEVQQRPTGSIVWGLVSMDAWRKKSPGPLFLPLTDIQQRVSVSEELQTVRPLYAEASRHTAISQHNNMAAPANHLPRPDQYTSKSAGSANHNEDDNKDRGGMAQMSVSLNCMLSNHIKST
ncbi:hypothetical protein NQZ68_039149, partial [Dissostichus eleginoides]